MRLLVSILVLLPLLATPARLQTTGVPGINDYTVGGLVPGSTSCTTLTLTGGGTFVFSVSATAPGLPFFIFATVGPPGVTCCRGCFLPQALSPCLIPPILCAPTNQSIDIFPGTPCVFVTPITGTTGAGGIGSVTITLPPGLSIGTQAGIFDPGCNSGSLPLTLTQAYSIIT